MKEHHNETISKEFKKITLGSWIRILIVVLLVVAAYAWGVIEGSRYSPKYPNMSQKYGRQMMNDYKRQYQNGAVGQAAMSHDSMSMNDMVKMLEGKTGDELDKAFLEAMIPHHQGAIDMAKYLTGAKHDELRKLGADIISAQANEIEMMKKWLKDWGYTNTGSVSATKIENPEDDMMREHCRQMPEMVGCEDYR